MYNGIINVYKEPGYTSHDVVARLRGITHQKKIGHTGTLDPAAVGVLLVCMGKATHVCDMLTDETKEYRAVLLLGITSDTQDTTGTILSQSPTDSITEEQVREVISHYVGELSQIPPMYSALKVNGRKLYDLARAGIEVERKPRQITIFNIEIEEIALPRVTMRVTCSKGTYIRTLCHDIGSELGCGGAMEQLARTRVGRFDLSTTYKLDEIEEVMKQDKLEEILIAPETLFDNLPTLVPNERGMMLAHNGNVLSMDDILVHNVDQVSNIISLSHDQDVRLIDTDGFFYGIYRYDEEHGLLKPQRMFLC